MPRMAGILIPNLTHRVTQRRNRREHVFFGDGGSEPAPAGPRCAQARLRTCMRTPPPLWHTRPRVCNSGNKAIRPQKALSRGRLSHRVLIHVLRNPHALLATALICQ
jgi:hypothetical protein